MKKQQPFIVILLIAGLIVGFYHAISPTPVQAPHKNIGYELPSQLQSDKKDRDIATFAGGCFRCIEQVFEQQEGVKEVVVGYAGGDTPNPSYEQVSSGKTKYIETAQIYFDPQEVSYSELLQLYWIVIDPTDDGGQFVDRGPQYAPAIFYHNEEQYMLALQSKEELQASSEFSGKQVRTPINPYTTFYPAEEYHQDFYKKSPEVYLEYKENSGRK